MPETASRRVRWLLVPLLVLAVLLSAAWTATAVSFQLAGPFRVLALVLVPLLGIAVLALGWHRPAKAFLLLAFCLAGVAGWWAGIEPSAERDWAPEVSRTVTAAIAGNRITLHDVRNFDWRSETDFTPRWETRNYDLNLLNQLDLVTSTWGNPAIAHTLISFGFADGQRVVFSAEIRRETTEAFSEIGGFFKQFELAMIAADENDIIRLRTDARGETVSLFPLKVTPAQMRALFLAYLERGNALARQPEFYQTLTTNCTTVVFHLARLVVPGMPMDWRILLSGYVPDYLQDYGVLRTSLPLAETKRAAVIDRSARPPAPDFSAAIRAASPLYGAAAP